MPDPRALPSNSSSSCPGCGLANYDGLCPHCRGDQDGYERELVPPFPSGSDDPEPLGTCVIHGDYWTDDCMRCGW